MQVPYELLWGVDVAVKKNCVLEPISNWKAHDSHSGPAPMAQHHPLGTK